MTLYRLEFLTILKLNSQIEWFRNKIIIIIFVNNKQVNQNLSPLIFEITIRKKHLIKNLKIGIQISQK